VPNTRENTEEIIGRAYELKRNVADPISGTTYTSAAPIWITSGREIELILIKFQKLITN
jgi:hypothetical protein